MPSLWPTAVRSRMKEYVSQTPEFAKAFKGAAKQYAGLRQSVPRTVVRWEWCVTPRYELDPCFYVLDQTLRPGRVLKTKPRKNAGLSAYGFDSSNRLVITRDYTQWEDVYTEGFWTYSPERIDSVRYNYPPHNYCINVESLYLSQDGPSAFFMYAGGGILARLYHQEAGRLLRVYEQNESGVRNGKPIFDKNTYSLSYRGNALVRVRLDWGGGDSTSWAPPRYVTTTAWSLGVWTGNRKP